MAAGRPAAAREQSGARAFTMTGKLRVRLRLGEVGAAAFAAMASFDDVLQSDGDREKKKQRQAKGDARSAGSGAPAAAARLPEKGRIGWRYRSRCTLSHGEPLGRRTRRRGSA